MVLNGFNVIIGIKSIIISITVMQVRVLNRQYICTIYFKYKTVADWIKIRKLLIFYADVKNTFLQQRNEYIVLI